MINLEKHTFDPGTLGQRGIGDMLEEYVKFTYRDIAEIEGEDWKDAPTARSIQDFSVGKVLYDVKTTDLDRNFSMPNLISVKRLIKLYANPEAELKYVLINYKEENGLKVITKYEERLIESISWDCLAIQNLGEGQLQLITTQEIAVYEGTREEWLKELKKRVLVYLDKTIEKMEKRKNYWNGIA